MDTHIIPDIDLLARELCEQAARRTELEQRVSDLEAERDAYRELLLLCLEALADTTAHTERHAERLRELRAEIRRYTAAQVMERAA